MDDPLFWAKVSIEPDGCWEWLGARDSHGYGHLNRGAKTGWLAHRRAWFLTYGSLPEKGIDLDHLCRNPPCVNPAHLEAVPHRTNNLRGLIHNREKTHCAHGHAFTAANTKPHRVRGAIIGRVCRVCRNAYRRELRRRHREAA